VAAGASATQQLIRAASLYKLERSLRQRGVPAEILWESSSDWREIDGPVQSWIAEAAPALAQASLAIACVMEPRTVIIDGAMPDATRRTLAEAVRSALAAFNAEGIKPFAIEEGTIGVQARALGAASLPLAANFMVDRDSLYKS
jgi:predicted NBD/HSP70 family sugar kinase